jgi:hypothetical protein
MAIAVYVLCALTSFACAVMLVRGWVRSRERFLLWASVCFVALAANNLLLFVDLALLPTTIDLSAARGLTALAGVALLLFGLVWEDGR